MRTKQAFKNIVSNIILQLVVSISGIILPRIFLVAYQSTVNGMVQSISQFIAYLALVEAGVAAAATVELYSPLSKGDRRGINEILTAANSFYYKSGLIYVVCIAALVLIYPYLIQNQLDPGFVRWAILVMALNNLVDYFFIGKYRVLLTADQRSYVINLAHALGTFLNIFATYLLIRLGAGVLLVKLSVTVFYLMRSAIVYIYVRRHYRGLYFKQKSDRPLLSQKWAAFFHQVVGVIVNNSDVVILTIMLGKASLLEISVYSVYSMVLIALNNLTGSISDGLTSGFGNLLAEGENEKIKKVFSNFEYGFFIMIFCIYFCMGVLLLPFVALYTRDITDVEYIRPVLVFLFTLRGLIQTIRRPALNMIISAGHYKQTKYRALAEAIISIAVSLALVKPFGVAGVVIGSLCSYLYRSFDVIVYSAKRLVKGSLKTTLLRLLRNAVLTGILVWAASFVNWASIDSWLKWILYGAATGAISFIAFFAVNTLFEFRQTKELFLQAKSLRGKK